MPEPGSERNESAWRWDGDRLVLALHAQPGASRTGWAGWYSSGSIRVRLAAKAVDGKANQALIRFLAQSLGVGKSQIRLLVGHTARSKIVEATGVKTVIWQKVLAELGTSL
ncbi:MAG: DUF167 domain-containing protein [Deltaproteobacteria bacterium]|nr:DUF167 domain-containing protein [Deltaproteobacteria bacterium]